MKLFRYFVCLILLCVPATLCAGNDFRGLSDEEAAKVLVGFRNYRMPGDLCLKFTIEHQLRKSDESEFFVGTLYGTWDEQGPILRVEIARESKQTVKKSFILRGGKNPELWSLNEQNKPVRIDATSTAPFFEGLIFTPFDLQTPFIYWAEADYEQTRRFRGRPVHFFKMNPPENFRKEGHDISFVRIGFDRVYNALVSAEVFNKEGDLQKTFSLSRVQKVGEQYTIRELVLRDETTRDKDEFVVNAAAVDIRLPKSMFDPKALTEAAPLIPPTVFFRF